MPHTDDELIVKHGFRNKTNLELDDMSRRHAEKKVRIQKQLDEYEDPDGFGGIVYKMVESTRRDLDVLGIPMMTKAAAKQKVLKQRDKLREKVGLLHEIPRLTEVEKGKRKT